MFDWKLVTRCCWGINLATGVPPTHRPDGQQSGNTAMLRPPHADSWSPGRPGGDDLDFDERAGQRPRPVRHQTGVSTKATGVRSAR